MREETEREGWRDGGMTDAALLSSIMKPEGPEERRLIKNSNSQRRRESVCQGDAEEERRRHDLQTIGKKGKEMKEHTG